MAVPLGDSPPSLVLSSGVGSASTAADEPDFRMEICCDRFHFPNHKDPWCKKNVDPAKVEQRVPEFTKANTSAAEECFSWLARSKHIFRNMHEAHFLFFKTRLMHLRNKYLCDAKGDPSPSDPDLEPEASGDALPVSPCAPCDEEPAEASSQEVG